MPPSSERKISQLDNDIRAIYDILTDVGDTLNAHSGRFDMLESRVTRVETKVDTLDGKVDALDTKFTEKFEGLETKLDAVLARLA